MAVRRSFQYGFWVQYRMSQHQMQLHVKLHRLQVIISCTLFMLVLVLHCSNALYVEPAKLLYTRPS